MDPARVVRNDLPPDLAIKSVTADGRLYRDPASLTLRAATANIEIDFAALSFADPRTVSVRYRLEGFDQAWVDPGTRRQAFYTNLPPGHYRFRVIAANNEGVWNRTGVSVDFEIPPTFLQSRWFLALCGVLALVLFWLIYRLRVAQVAGRIRKPARGAAGRARAHRPRIARYLAAERPGAGPALPVRREQDAGRGVFKGASGGGAQARRRYHRRWAQPRAGSAGRRWLGRSAGAVEGRAVGTGFDPAIPIRIVVEGRPRPVHPLVSVELGGSPARRCSTSRATPGQGRSRSRSASLAGNSVWRFATTVSGLPRTCLRGVISRAISV